MGILSHVFISLSSSDLSKLECLCSIPSTVSADRNHRRVGWMTLWPIVTNISFEQNEEGFVLGLVLFIYVFSIYDKTVK